VGNFIQVLYSGVVIGAAYALMGSGLTLIWGGIRFLNMAHGALYTAGGFAAYWIVTQNDLPAWMGLICGFVVAGALAVVIHLVLYRHLLRQNDGQISALMAGIGVAIALQAWLTIRSPRDVGLDPLVGGQFKLPYGVPATGEGVFIVVFSLVILGTLAIFLARSSLGMQVRAIADNREGAHLVGIRADRIFLLVMAVGGGLAGLAGVMLGSVYLVSPSSGFNAFLFALIVTVFGGVGSLGGTVAAAYVVGLVQSSVSFWLGSQWVLPILFGVLMLFLVLRPQGIAGKITFEAGA
jgi:branched-chain amino acid transport system permease protein